MLKDIESKEKSPKELTPIRYVFIADGEGKAIKSLSLQSTTQLDEGLLARFLQALQEISKKIYGGKLKTSVIGHNLLSYYPCTDKKGNALSIIVVSNTSAETRKLRIYAKRFIELVSNSADAHNISTDDITERATKAVTSREYATEYVESNIQ